MKKFKQIFKTSHPVIGMIHVRALPGTPKNSLDINQIIDIALEEAKIYKNAGIDSIMLENMHDIPYLKNEVGHEISTAMALVCHAVKQEVNLPIGIQILAGANKAALAVAKNAGLEYIRAEGFVFGHVADEGYIDSQAAELIRYRKQIGAEHIAIFADIKKKHSSHALTADVSIADTAHAAGFFLSDGVIVTGSRTGSSTNLQDIEEVKSGTQLPVIIGSGVTYDNLDTYFNISNALIVGSYFKKEGNWNNELDEKRILDFMKKVKLLR
jgi:membrane complex biogenesis BtpA family protein